MADQQKHKADEATETLSPQQLAMIKAIAEAMKTPYIDQSAVENKERARIRLRQERDMAEKSKAAIEDSCSHVREDNTSRVAWITNHWRSIDRYVTEGFCQLCNKHYRPGVEGYAEMLKIPVGKAGVIQ